jgi:hypothetical protein
MDYQKIGSPPVTSWNIKAFQVSRPPAAFTRYLPAT